MTIVEDPTEPPHDDGGAEEPAPLESVWADSPGIIGFLTTVDHKRVGRRYLVTAFVFLLVGGLEALVMRSQLATAEGGVVDAATYNALMTMHGTTMIFLFNTPVFAGFGNYLVPLQIGARDMAFPRLNALSYWIFLLSGTFIYTSFLVGQVPDGGWFAYVPLTDDRFLPGAGIDYWAVGQVFLGTYLLFIPATGIVSMVIPTFARRPLAGHTWVIGALVATSFISFGLWIHHMFAVGVPILVASFFSAASAVIAIPSGIQIFAWVLTVVQAPGKIRFEAPMLWALAFIVTFVLGGVTGVMVAIVPFDLQAHDSYFVVAHFHYVLMGGTVFPTFAGLHFWYPKMTGRMLNRTQSLASFWLVFVGFHVTFFPQHFVGLLGMPRRIYWYGEETGWEPFNLVSSLGAVVIAAGMIVMATNFARSRRRGPPAGADPWGGESLEWTLPSKPPDGNFGSFPIVSSFAPAWDRAAARPTSSVTHLDGEDLTVAEGGEHKTLVSSVIDAAEIDVVTMPGPSYWPLVFAGAMFVFATSVVFRSLFVGVFAVAVMLVTLVAWHREIGS